MCKFGAFLQNLNLIYFGLNKYKLGYQSNLIIFYNFDSYLDYPDYLKKGRF